LFPEKVFLGKLLIRRLEMATATRINAETLIPAGSWTVDPVHSSAGFEVKHMVVSTFRGDFREFGAELESREGAVRLVGTASPASIDVRDENLAAHLASPEFFDAERYPEVRFESTAIQVDPEGNLVAAGDLTVRGHTEAVEARGSLVHIDEDIGGGQRIGLDLAATIDRRAFGLEWNAPLPKGGFALGNDVKLLVRLELVPKEN
jgi:polyisoprenoid-binding protein YceI